MARIRWHGTELTATPIRQLENGNWLMASREHGARITIGTEIEVRPDEVITMAADKLPPTEVDFTKPPLTAEISKSALEIELAMAEERKTLTPVAELLALAPKTVERPEEA